MKTIIEASLVGISGLICAVILRGPNESLHSFKVSEIEWLLFVILPIFVWILLNFFSFVIQRMTIRNI
jgi:membrane associated rhomboid family serine protease